MNIFEAVLLGFVQGVTEFLPVSSSGHLVLTQQLLGWDHPDLIFDVWLHLATLFAVLIFFWKDFWQLNKKGWLTIIISSIPAAGVGLFFSDAIESWFGSIRLVAMTLLITGILNIITGQILRKKDEVVDSEAVTFKQGLVIGLFQALAIIPGISRSGSTVFAGVKQGIDRVKVFKFSFLLSTPAILGASLLQLIKASKEGVSSELALPYLIAATTALGTGLMSLYIFKFIIKKSRLDLFGYYCLLLSLSYWIFF